MQLQKNKLALEKTKYERTRSAERLANLKADRELFVVKSPADGIMVYGYEPEVTLRLDTYFAAVLEIVGRVILANVRLT